MTYEVRYLKRRINQRRADTLVQINNAVANFDIPIVFEGEASGSVTAVPMTHGGAGLGRGVPIVAPCEAAGAVIVWKADNAPTSDWTLTLRKKAVGARDFTDVSQISVTVNHYG